MLTDRFGLAVSTSSPAARDAYVAACDLLLTSYPGAVPAFDRAIAADPAFALAHAGRARALQIGDPTAARAAIATAQSLAGAVDAREASHIAVFDLLVAGRNAEAFAAIKRHLADWPRDVMVANPAANQAGLIGLSGRAGRDEEQVDFLAWLQPHYGQDWWFEGHYAMALSEARRAAEARPYIERSMATQRHNAAGAHAMAHVFYELGEPRAGRDFMRGWLMDYPRNGGMRGHLAWHQALWELADGDVDSGLALYADAFSADPYPGMALVKVVDSVAFLWRAELAGHAPPRHLWRDIHAYAERNFPRPGVPMVDWHVTLAEAMAGDEAGFAARIAAMEAMVAEGRLASGPATPALSRAFAAYIAGDHATAIALIRDVLPDRARLGGSRAQTDLVEFTLLRALVLSGREDEARDYLAHQRRTGPVGVPVAGLAA